MQKYELLESGDKIKKGDEYWSPITGEEWRDVHPEDIDKFCLTSLSQPIRRKIPKDEVCDSAELVKMVEKCEECGGKGFDYVEIEPGEADKDVCDYCLGSGYVLNGEKNIIEAILTNSLPDGSHNKRQPAILKEAIINVLRQYYADEHINDMVSQMEQQA